MICCETMNVSASYAQHLHCCSSACPQLQLSRPGFICCPAQPHCLQHCCSICVMKHPLRHAVETCCHLVQGLRAASNAGSDMYTKNRLHSDSIRAGQNSTAWLNSVEDLSCTDGNNQSVTLDGVKSLMHAGSWLQMLRAKLAGSSYRQQPGQVCLQKDNGKPLL